MYKKWFMLFAFLSVSCLNASTVEFSKSKFRIYRVALDCEQELVSIDEVNFEDIYEIYDDNFYYGFYVCLVPNIFAYVDNLHLDRKRYLNIQTGECFDVEPILNSSKKELKVF